MNSVYRLEQHLQLSWDAPRDNQKHHLSTNVSNFHPCRYDADLGSDDSEPESQASETASSQDSYTSGHSPATSYDSEDNRSESRQDASQHFSPELSDVDRWPASTGHVLRGSPLATSDKPCQGLTRDVPFRPKPETNSCISDTKKGSNGLPAITTAVNCRVGAEPFQNRRGRSVVQTVPPTLKRDTDNTDNIVRMIVLFCVNLINSIWCSNDQSMSTVGASQQGANVLPLQVFITETLRRSKTSYSTLQIALYYLILLKQCLPALSPADRSGCRAMQCGRRMFLTSLILASKYLQDRNYSARAWSKISGLPLKEINENEKKFLAIVSWDLHVPKVTFENWSKIVLYVCKRSLDPENGCRPGVESSYKGPGASPHGQRPCVLQSNTKDPEALRSWWLVNLRQLKTDIVKCGVKTQKYVDSITPFRTVPPMFRPISPDSDTTDDEKFKDILFSQDHKTSNESRQPSLERTKQHFEPAPDLLHPAAPLALPPPPTMKNLPTPQTTPQADISGWWTPRLLHQNSRSSLRCKASASALSNAFRKHCPMANLETCPPPMPRAQTLSQGRESCVSVEALLASSQASSPESYVSDFSSFAPRSRSSSISSTSSWATSSSQNSSKLAEHPSRLFRDLNGAQQCVQSIACPRQQSVDRQYAPLVAQGIERPRTAFKVPSATETNFEQVNSWCETTITAHEYSSDPPKQEADAIMAGACEDPSVTRSRARPRPRLARSGTQIYNPQEAQEAKTQHLKRSRSETFEIAQCLPESEVAAIRQYLSLSRTAPIQGVPDILKTVQRPNQPWAEPRKPLQIGMHNKRLALQLSCDPPASSAAAVLAGQLLRSNFESHSNRLGSLRQ